MRLSSDTISYGESLTFIAEVAPANGSGGSADPINTGSVVFREGSKELGQAAVVGGVAKLVTNSLEGGLHSRFVAAYSGDGVNYQPSESIDGVITTIAGNGIRSFTGDGQQGVDALLDRPSDTVVDSKGNLYVMDTRNNRIRKVDLATGVITTVVEAGGFSSADGVLALDANDNLFVAAPPVKFAPVYISRVDLTTGSLTQILAGGITWGQNNMPGRVAGLAVARNGDIYFSDQDSNRVGKISATTRLLTTVAGTGTAGYNGDSQRAQTVQLDSPSGVALDDSGNVYICDAGNFRVRKVELATGNLTTIAGNGAEDYPIAGSLATQSPMGRPSDLVYSRGSLFVAQSSGLVSRIDLTTGRIYAFAGTDNDAPLADNVPATESTFVIPVGIAADAAGNIFVADRIDERVRRIDYESGLVRTVAGGGSIGDNGPATAAVVGAPSALALSPDGQQLIVSAEKHRVVRQVNLATEIITEVAGNRRWGDKGDGKLATEAQFNTPSSVAFDADKNLVIADPFSFNIRKISRTTGRIETLVGTGTRGYNGDALLGTETQLAFPSDIAFDWFGRMFIADSGNNRIRMFDPETGRVTTVAGNGTAGFAGDNGPAQLAQLKYPTSIAFDQRGDLYIADRDNNRIRRVDMQTGVISTVVGNGGRDLNISGQGLLNSSLSVSELAFDAFGRLVAGAPNFISAPSNFLVEIDFDANSIRRLAGRPNSEFNGDNISLSDANIGSLSGFAFDENNNFYFADSAQNRVKKVSYLSVHVLAVLHITPVETHRIYGSASPSFQYDISGFVDNETLSTSDVSGQPLLLSNANSSSPVGNYTIVAAAGTLVSRKYAFQFHTAAYKITPAKLTVKANDQVKIYGDDIPELTVAYEGFVKGDSPASLNVLPVVTTNAGRASPVSQTPYSIRVSGAASKNYDISYEDGALRVLPAPLLVTANDLTKVYGEQVPTLTYAFTGFMNGETQSTSDLIGTLDLSTSASNSSTVGTYAIDFVSSDVRSINYDIQYKSGALAVTPASLTIIAEDSRKRFCEQMPALSPTYSGFVLGDGPSQLDRLPTIATPVSVASPVGTYQIQIFGASDDNYQFTYQAGQFQVVAQPTTLILHASSAETKNSQTVDLTADVLPQDACQPIGLGQVEFYDNQTLLGVGYVQQGRAVLANVALAVGDHSIVAKYLDPSLQFEASQSTATSIHSWESADVNRDKFVTALDALLIINWLNQGQRPIDPRDMVFDVNDDQFITAIDALLVINRLNQG